MISTKLEQSEFHVQEFAALLSGLEPIIGDFAYFLSGNKVTFTDGKFDRSIEIQKVQSGNVFIYMVDYYRGLNRIDSFSASDEVDLFTKVTIMLAKETIEIALTGYAKAVEI